MSVPVLDREHCQPRDDTKTSSSAERCTCSGFRADSGSLDSWHCVGKRCDDAHLLHHRRTWKRLLHSGAAERGRGVQPENTGLITSILMIVKTIGQILMPLAVSAIRASTGETAGMLLIAAAFLADAVAVAGLIYVKKKDR